MGNRKSAGGLTGTMRVDDTVIDLERVSLAHMRASALKIGVGIDEKLQPRSQVRLFANHFICTVNGGSAGQLAACAHCGAPIDIALDPCPFCGVLDADAKPRKTTASHVVERIATRPTIEVNASDFAAVIRERDALRAQVKEIQGRMTEMVEAKLSRRVRAFMLKAGQPVAWTPAIPEKKFIARCAALILEECFSLLESAGVELKDGEALGACGVIRDRASLPDLDFDLPATVIALADIAHAAEVFLATIGVDGDRVMDAVHAAKVEGGVAMVEVSALLEAQGWRRG